MTRRNSRVCTTFSLARSSLSVRSCSVGLLSHQHDECARSVVPADARMELVGNVEIMEWVENQWEAIVLGGETAVSSSPPIEITRNECVRGM